MSDSTDSLPFAGSIEITLVPGKVVSVAPKFAGIEGVKKRLAGFKSARVVSFEVQTLEIPGFSGNIIIAPVADGWNDLTGDPTTTVDVDKFYCCPDSVVVSYLSTATTGQGGIRPLLVPQEVSAELIIPSLEFHTMRLAVAIEQTTDLKCSTRVLVRGRVVLTGRSYLG